MDYDEQRIIEGLRKGENHSYKYIYDHHYVMLCRIAYVFLKDDSLSQNLVDETIFHIYENRKTLFIITSLRAYLVQSVRNRCISLLRRAHSKREVNFSDISTSDDLLFSISGMDSLPLGTLIEKELEGEILLAVNRLPTESRAVFEKSRYEGKSYRTIAQELNISVNTVKYHMKNALLLLRQYLDKYLLLILSCLYIFYFIKLSWRDNLLNKRM